MSPGRLAAVRGRLSTAALAHAPYPAPPSRLLPKSGGLVAGDHHMRGPHAICENEVLVNEAAAFLCPTCEEPIEPGEDYVTAWEYVGDPGFTLHAYRGLRPSTRVETRFHVGHFRGRLGDFVYELVQPPPPRE